jgi:hypothetical protein
MIVIPLRRISVVGASAELPSVRLILSTGNLNVSAENLSLILEPSAARELGGAIALPVTSLKPICP